MCVCVCVCESERASERACERASVSDCVCVCVYVCVLCVWGGGGAERGMGAFSLKAFQEIWGKCVGVGNELLVILGVINTSVHWVISGVTNTNVRLVSSSARIVQCETKAHFPFLV